MHLAYITTGYPYVSHTFIQNEVLELRALGVRVDTYSVARSPLTECRSEADREAYETTSTMRPVGLRRYLAAHARALRARPLAYLASLRRALSLAGTAPRDIARHVAYFLQGIVLADEVMASGAEHIHAHFANVSTDLAMLASIATGGEVGWSFTQHGPREFSDVEHFRLGEKAKSARFVICISEFAKSQLMALTDLEHWGRFHVIRCGVDTARFSPPSERSAGDRSTRIACVGRLVPEKGQAVLIRAANQLVANGRDIELVFVGDGPTRASLQALAERSGLSQRARFLGSKSPDEVIDVLREADVFCLPSFAEGVPIVLMEAMAMGVPPVTSRIAGIPELIRSAASGRLADPGSGQDLASALDELVGSEALRRSIGKEARNRILNEYSLRDNVAALARRFATELEKQN